MVRETGVQSHVESCQRLLKCYLMPPCWTLCIIRYEWRVKWSNPGNKVAPSPIPRYSSYWKGEPSGHPRLWSPTLLTNRIRKNAAAWLILSYKLLWLNQQDVVFVRQTFRDNYYLNRRRMQNNLSVETKSKIIWGKEKKLSNIKTDDI